MAMEQLHVKVANIFCTFHFGRSIDLEALGRAAGQQYQPGRFRYLKLRLCGATLLVYGNGKVICSGAKSMETVGRAASSLEDILLMDFDYGVVLASPPEVRNVVASGTTGYQIDLAKLSQMDRQASWEPELFCGLKFTLSRT